MDIWQISSSDTVSRLAICRILPRCKLLNSTTDNTQWFHYPPLHQPTIKAIGTGMCMTSYLSQSSDTHHVKLLETGAHENLASWTDTKANVQPVLNRKHASLQFLHALASTPTATPVATSFLPSLAPPPPTRPSSRLTSKTTSPVDGRPPPRGPKGKSKADILREYRLQMGLYDVPSISQLVLINAQVNHTYRNT